MFSPVPLVQVVPDVVHPDGTVHRGIPAVRGPLAELRARRNMVWCAARAMTEDAANKNRNFTPAEQGRWDVLYAELDELDRRIQASIRYE